MDTKIYKKRLYPSIRKTNPMCSLSSHLCIVRRRPSLGHTDYCNEIVCGENEGDCDEDNQCEKGLNCGTNNCEGVEFDEGDDCCSKSTALDDNFPLCEYHYSKPCL